MRSWLSISLYDYQQFWINIRHRVDPSTKIMAVVKANAYGLGAIELSTFLDHNKLVDWLAVATGDEALELRKHGINMPILILSDPLSPLLGSNLDADWVIGDADGIHKMETVASFVNKRINIHLKIDTGMNRIGCHPTLANSLISQINQSPHLRLRGIMSHFTSSDDTDSNATQHQIRLFSTTVSHLSETATIIRHISNSNGIQHHGAEFDLVRIGVKSYESIASLHAQIIQIKPVSAGESIGYNRTYVVTNDTNIATVGIGYADGIPRKFNGVVRVVDQLCPVVGLVCMDTLMVDIGILPVQVGDHVTFFDKPNSGGPSIQTFASNSRRTIYEVLTSLGQRIERRYIEAS